MSRHAAGLLLAAALLATPAHPARADAPPAAKALDPKVGGDAVFEGRSADGLAYFWRGPKRYDASKGVGLTVILHGSNLSRGWGFANHPSASFRPDDLVLCPDGTTSNGKGGFNFLDDPKDVKRLHALLDEAKKAFKVRATFLYGHSQGSFFALLYAGEHPEEIDGVVAHASGMWTNTRLGTPGRHQAIVLMHGTQDPVVPYAQSVGALDAFAEAGYESARLYSLEGWNHWPAEVNGDTPHTSQELAWVEGMTTMDADRLDACLAVLADVKEKPDHDWAGLHSLARHALGSAFAKEATKARATKAIAVVEALAKKHAAGLASVKPGAPADGAPWMTHLPVFLRQFRGVPACDELAAAWKATLDKQRERAVAHLRKYYGAREKDPATAFEEGTAAVAEGFLWCETQDVAFLETLEKWQKDAKKLKFSKKALKDFAVVEGAKAAAKKGSEAYASVCRTAGDT